MTVDPAEIGAFQEELLTGRAKDAMARLGRCPALAGTDTQEGRYSFSLAVDTNHYELVKLFLASGADVDALDVNRFPMVCRAAKKRKAESLRALLEYKPDLGRCWEERQTPLEMAYADVEGKVEEHPAIFKLLIRAGALEAKDKRGMTALGRSYVQGREMDYIHFLHKNGADIAALRKNNAFVFPAAEERDDERDNFDYVADTFDQLIKQESMHIGYHPEMMLEFFCSTTNTLNEGLDGIRVIKNYLHAHLEHLYFLLSADIARPLTDPEYWSKYGGAAKGMEFVETLRQVIPDHLAYMRERFDCAELLRTDATPREGSVTAGYVRGGVGEGVLKV